MGSTGALLIASENFREEDLGNEEIPVFLPMYPLDGTTVIKREIAMLRKACISPIIVLLGYQKELLKNHLSHNRVIFVEDEKYREHGFEESLQRGLLEAREWMERVLVVPVECPAFSMETIERLLACKESAVPVYQKEEGYPRLYHISEDHEKKIEQVEVEDAGILLSLREKNGIQKIEEYVKAKRSENELRCTTRLTLTKGENFFGPGVCQLLQYIDETGSIQAAAERMKMSYTKGWKMVNLAEKEMGFLFLNRCNGGKNGGSSTLTEEGRLFMERYRAMVEDMEKMSRRFFDIYFQDFQ